MSCDNSKCESNTQSRAQQAESILERLQTVIDSMEQLRAQIPKTASTGEVLTTSEALGKAINEAAEAWRSFEMVTEAFYEEEESSSKGG